MNNLEFAARVSMYYTMHSPRIGILSYDKETQRFVISRKSNQRVHVFPQDGLHCGDTFIVYDMDDTWRIAQCERVGTEWRMLGSFINSTNCDKHLILYVPRNRLSRVRDHYLDESFRLEPLSDEFIALLLRKGVD